MSVPRGRRPTMFTLSVVRLRFVCKKYRKIWQLYGQFHIMMHTYSAYIPCTHTRTYRMLNYPEVWEDGQAKASSYVWIRPEGYVLPGVSAMPRHPHLSKYAAFATFFFTIISHLVSATCPNARLLLDGMDLCWMSELLSLVFGDTKPGLRVSGTPWRAYGQLADVLLQSP